MRAQSYEDVLADLIEKNPNVVVMTAENRAAIRGLPAKIGPRFIDVGICEQTMIGAAAGLALRGRIPVVHALSTFLVMRAFEFARTDVGIPGLPVKLVGAVPGFLSEANGPTHQALEDIALMRGIPGMQVVCPADAEELLEAMPVVVGSGAPCYVRYYAGPRRRPSTQAFVMGQAETLREGRHVAILTYGFLVAQALEAAEILGREGVTARVVNLRTLSPVDRDALVQAVRETELTVTLEDHFRVGGLHSILAETLLDHRVTGNVLSIALDGRWFRPGLLGDVLRHEGFTGPQIAERVHKALRGHVPAADLESSTSEGTHRHV
jgi:transketolase